jgi:hypothetical protein
MPSVLPRSDGQTKGDKIRRETKSSRFISEDPGSRPATLNRTIPAYRILQMQL